jgi:hypothetical protein
MVSVIFAEKVSTQLSSESNRLQIDYDKNSSRLMFSYAEPTTLSITAPSRTKKDRDIKHYDIQDNGTQYCSATVYAECRK